MSKIRSREEVMAQRITQTEVGEDRLKMMLPVETRLQTRNLRGRWCLVMEMQLVMLRSPVTMGPDTQG
jgi:hypothetical protein